MNVIKTNWINILGVFLATFVFAVCSNLLEVNSSQNFFQSIFSSLILICFYGVMFWALFALLLVIFDMIFIVKRRNNLKLMLLVEWLIICIPFIYWTIRFKQWIFLVAILTFLITQLLREKTIKNIINK